MTIEEAVADFRLRVEALFLSARPAYKHECIAYITGGHGEEMQHYVYVEFFNGHKNDEGREHPGPFVDMPLDDMIESMISAIAAEFPDHANQHMIWRIEPEYAWREAQKASRTFGTPAVPAHHALYCRLVAVPPTFAANCCLCGMTHTGDEPHQLTDQAIDEIVSTAIHKARETFFTKEDAKNLTAVTYVRSA